MKDLEELKTNLEIAIPILETKIMEGNVDDVYSLILKRYKRSLETILTKNPSEHKRHDFKINGGIRAVMDAMNTFDDNLMETLHRVEESFRKIYP